MQWKHRHNGDCVSLACCAKICLPGGGHEAWEAGSKEAVQPAGPTRFNELYVEAETFVCKRYGLEEKTRLQYLLDTFDNMEVLRAVEPGFAGFVVDTAATEDAQEANIE